MYVLIDSSRISRSARYTVCGAGGSQAAPWEGDPGGGVDKAEDGHHTAQGLPQPAATPGTAGGLETCECEWSCERQWHVASRRP